MGWERTEPSKVSVLVMLVDGGDGCSPLMSAAKCRGSATDLYNIFSGSDPSLSFTFEAKVTIGVAASSSSSAQSAHDLLVSMPTRARMICCHLWAEAHAVFVKRCFAHDGYWHLAACLCVRHGTHSFVSLIVSVVFSIASLIIISFSVVSLLMIDSLHTTRQRRWWMACTTCV